jgi:hypothetical protein
MLSSLCGRRHLTVQLDHIAADRKRIGYRWRGRRINCNLYVDRSVKARLDRRETRLMKIRRGIRQGCCLSLILFNVHIQYPTKEALERFGGLKIGQVIRTVTYADDAVLLADEETSI